MRNVLRVLAAVAVTTFAFAHTSAAQSRKFFSVGGGATIPTSDYGDYAKTGWMGGVGLGTGIGTGNAFVMVKGFYGKNNHDTDGESTSLLGGGANIGLMSSGESARIYGYVGGGMQQHKFNSDDEFDGESETKGFADAAVGVSLGSGKTHFWAQVGMVMGFGDTGAKTSYIPVMAGISVGW